MLTLLMEKIYNQRSFNHFFRHLKVVELTYRTIFSLKFTLRCQCSDFVPIISHRCHWQGQICCRCHWYRWQIATGVVDTGIKFATGIIDTGGTSVSTKTRGTGGKICPWCHWFRWCTLTLWIFENLKCPYCYFKWLRMMIHEENLRQKILLHSFNTVGTKTLFSAKSLVLFTFSINLFNLELSKQSDFFTCQN